MSQMRLKLTWMAAVVIPAIVGACGGAQVAKDEMPELTGEPEVVPFKRLQAFPDKYMGKHVACDVRYDATHPSAVATSVCGGGSWVAININTAEDRATMMTACVPESASDPVLSAKYGDLLRLSGTLARRAIGPVFVASVVNAAP